MEIERKRKRFQVVEDKPEDVSPKQQHAKKPRRGQTPKSLLAPGPIDAVDSSHSDIKKAISDPHASSYVSQKCLSPTSKIEDSAHLKKSLIQENLTPIETLSIENGGKKKCELSNRTHSTQLDPLGDSNLLPDFIALTEKKVIPIGPRFQAEVPEWDGSVDISLLTDSYINDPNTTNWLGDKVWPTETGTEKITKSTIGKGRPNSCICDSPGSVECIRLHVEEERVLLQSDLGDVFFSWKFNEMGQQVLESWSVKEQRTFDTMVKNCTGEDWIRSARKILRRKKRKDIVSYYFNVYILRRMSQQTRSSSSSRGLNTDGEDDDDKPHDLIRDSSERSGGRKKVGTHGHDSVKRRYLKG